MWRPRPSASNSRWQAPQAQAGDVFKLSASIEPDRLRAPGAQPPARRGKRRAAGRAVGPAERTRRHAHDRQYTDPDGRNAAATRARLADRGAQPARTARRRAGSARHPGHRRARAHRRGPRPDPAGPLHARPPPTTVGAQCAAATGRTNNALSPKLTISASGGWGTSSPTSSDPLPSSAVFSSDAFSGYARVSIPIAAPAGLGGMTPGLSLNYCERRGRRPRKPARSDRLQGARPIGSATAGAWAASATSRASSTPAFSARLLQPEPGRCRRPHRIPQPTAGSPTRSASSESNTATASGAESTCHPSVACATTSATGLITSGDGTVYHFGSNQVAPTESAIDTHGGEPLGNWTEALFHDAGSYHARVASRWHLRMVEDRQRQPHRI